MMTAALVLVTVSKLSKLLRSPCACDSDFGLEFRLRVERLIGFKV